MGLMGEIARTVCDGAGPEAVIGVIPGALAPREVSASGCLQIHFHGLNPEYRAWR